jgi:hypothetical protein
LKSAGFSISIGRLFSAVLKSKAADFFPSMATGFSSWSEGKKKTALAQLQNDIYSFLL